MCRVSFYLSYELIVSVVFWVKGGRCIIQVGVVQRQTWYAVRKGSRAEWKATLAKTYIAPVMGGAMAIAKHVEHVYVSKFSGLISRIRSRLLRIILASLYIAPLILPN